MRHSFGYAALPCCWPPLVRTSRTPSALSAPLHTRRTASKTVHEKSHPLYRPRKCAWRYGRVENLFCQRCKYDYFSPLLSTTSEITKFQSLRRKSQKYLLQLLRWIHGKLPNDSDKNFRLLLVSRRTGRLWWDCSWTCGKIIIIYFQRFPHWPKETVAHCRSGKL